MRIPIRRFLTATLCLAALSIINSVPAQTGCAPVPAGLVGWWRAEGNANDSAGTDQGIPEGGLAYAPGEVGRAFVFNGTDADVHIPASATLNVGAGNGMSVEAWIKPADVTAQHPLVEWNGSSFGAELWVGVIPPLGTGPGCLYGSFVDAGRQPNAISSADGLVVANVWQHVAMTYDKATGIAVLYLNGAVVQQETLGVFTPLTTGDLWLGLRPYDAGAGLRYAGLMDEVSVYNRALSPAEVEAIYAAGSSGKCALPPVIAVPYAFTNFAGLPGVSGSADGTGSAARFNWPASVAVDGAGNLYVADENNSTVRKVTPGGMVTTLAGLAGSPGSADGTGSAARFNSPLGVAVDSAGNVYVADCINDTIRKVTPAGVVTTLAGLAGVQGSADGTGSAARFYSPGGVAVDSAGNVYVADSYNHAIRKLTPAGGVTTLAGLAGIAGSADGLGSAARFFVPASVAVDAAGNVYVADQFNQTIRSISPVGLVATLAGQVKNAGSADGLGSAAQFYYPRGVAVDSAGNVYVGDEYNATIRQITPAGVVTTVAGLAGNPGAADGLGSAARFNHPGELAVDAAGYLYVADIWNHRITKGAPSSPPQTGCAPVPAGLVGWWAGEGNANDRTGANNGALEGGVTFVPGEVGQAFSFDGITAAVKIPASASLDVGAGDGLTIETWIRPADLTEERPLVEWNSGDLNNPYPYGVHFWTSVPPPNGPGAGCLFGNVWDALGGAHLIASAPGLLTTTAFQHAALTYSKTTGWAVIYLNGVAVAQQDFGSFTPLTTSDLYLGYRPAGVPVGQRFVGQMDEVSVYNRALSATEVLSIYNAGQAGKCAIQITQTPPYIVLQPSSQTVPVGGTATFSVVAGGTPPLTYQWGLNKWTGQWTVFLILPGATNASLTLTNVQLTDAAAYWVSVSNPYGTVASSSATLTVSAQSIYTAYAFTNFAGLPGVSGSADGMGSTARFNGPPGVAVDGAGNVYVADSTNNTIRRVTSGGLVTTLAGLAGSPGSADGTGSAARFSAPTGVAVDKAGNLYVGDAGNALIRKVTPAGVVTTLAGLAGATGSTDGTGSAARFYQPAGVAVDSAGNVYVADYFNYTIRKVTPGRVVTTLAGHAGQAGSADGTGSAARFYAPFAVAVDATGNVYVADQFNQTIRQISPAGLVTTLAGQAMQAGSADGIGTAAQFSAPSGVAVDAAGNLFVGDQLNETIRKITPAGAVTTLAGLVGSVGSADGIGSEARFNKPCGVAVDSAGYLYVADPWNSRITKGAPWGLAQTACAPAPSGLVGWWRAEGTALDQTGVNDGLLEGPVSFAPAEVGQGFAFDGTNAYVKVPASPSLDVGPGPGFTVEGWIKPSDLRERPIVEWNSGLTSVPYGAHLWMSTVLPNGNGPGCLYADLVDTNEASHTIASAGGLLSTDTFQHVALTFSRTNGATVLYLNGASVAQATLGAFVPKTAADFYLGTRIAGGAQNHFWAGLMDEMTLYDRALSATEIEAIYHAGSAGKCVTLIVSAPPSITSEPLSQTVAPGATVTFNVVATGTPPLSYHWRTNTYIIPGATNASLTLSNVQVANVGGYSVIVSNSFGSVTSSTAVLTVTLTGAAPLITSEPWSEAVSPGGTANFYVAATGAPPLTYDWRMNTSIIAGATNATLTLSNVSAANAGAYSVIVSNPFGSVTSSTATLTVASWITPALVQAGLASGVGSQPVTVPILLIANGNENALAFTLDFSPAALTYTNIVLGPGASNATLVFNAAQATNGFLGAAVALPAGAVFKAGTQQVAEVTFTTAIVTNLTYTTVGFGSQVTSFQVAGANASALPANSTPGYVRLAPTPFEGDVAPRPNGDELVTVIDWVQEARFVAGLDSPTNGSEFQRADCAPRSTLGDGAITIADWVQVGRYLTGLDPLTPAGGPTSPVVAIPGVLTMQKNPASGPVPRDQSRRLQIQDVLILQGQPGTVSVNLQALGDENALGFSLAFDPARLTYAGAGAGSALSSADGAMFIVNDQQAASGRLGFALGLPAGATFPSGNQQVASISFRAPSASSGGSPLALANQPVVCEVSDAFASALTVDYLNGTVQVSQPPALSITLSGLAIELSWPRWATNFVLEQASGQLSSTTSWSSLGATPAATATANVLTLPLSATNKLYRLRQQ